MGPLVPEQKWDNFKIVQRSNETSESISKRREREDEIRYRRWGCQQRKKILGQKFKTSGKKQSPSCVLDKSSNLMVGRKSVLKRWKEYFDNLF